MAGIKIRAKSKKGVTLVKAILTHPMETGRRVDQKSGKLIPAYFINEITAELNGQLVFSGDWGPAIAKDPFLAFSFRAGKKGDLLKINWVDTKGKSDSKEVEIK